VQTGLVHADYLTDPGRHVDESRRTSLIIDPKSGHMPPLTPRRSSAKKGERGAHGGERCRARGRTRRFVSRSTALRALHHARPAGDDPANALPTTSRSSNRRASRDRARDDS
jgi:hypothetical protein